MKTKTDQVRELLCVLTPREISEQVGVTLDRIHMIRWLERYKAEHGTSYAAMKMRELRRDRDYREREKNQQSAYDRRVSRDPQKRARRALTRRLWKIAREDREILARLRP